MQRSNTSAPRGYKQPSFGLPVCPQCGKRMNPLVAWLYKTKWEYRCPQCGCCSNVLADPKAVGFGLAAIAIGLVVLLLFIFLGSVSVLALVLVILPFFVFALLSPFLVRLQAISPAREPAPRAGMPNQRQQPRQQQQPSRRPPPARPGASQSGAARPQNRGSNARPKLFDTAEFGTRKPRDFSHYQDK